jgi:hypothetical protein
MAEFLPRESVTQPAWAGVTDMIDPGVAPLQAVLVGPSDPEIGETLARLPEGRLRTLAHSNAQFQLSLAASRFRHAGSRFEARGR